MTQTTVPDQELNGVEIFRAGTYHLGHEVVQYSEADVQQLAENTNKLLSAAKHEPPVKLGHDDNQAFAKLAGQPAAGWIKRVFAQGNRLFADFARVPGEVAEAIKRGRYRHVSSEIYDGAQTQANFGDVVKGLTLRAVAILGADVPVVKGMNPLMLASDNTKGFRVLTLEVAPMTFAEDGKLKVHANRHGLDALVGLKGKPDQKFRVHAQHPDDTYDVHDIKDGSQVHKAVPHENLTLLSETFTQEGAMDATKLAELENQKKDAETKLAEQQAENKKLVAKMNEDRLNAFAEKYKGLLKQPPLLSALKALAFAEAGAVVKLSEGKEPVSYLDAVMQFAEQLIAAKPVLFGEVTPAVTKEGEMKAKSAAVKLAEKPFLEFAQKHGITHIERADLAVEARQKFAEAQSSGKKVKYRDILLAEAATRLGTYSRGNYAEINPEVA
jgi:hypothetical protein